MSDDMEALQLKYRQSFKTKEATLTQLGFNADRDPEALRAFFHKLAGSSGLYGYMELHKLCLSAEDANNAELIKLHQDVVDWLRQNMNKEA